MKPRHLLLALALLTLLGCGEAGSARASARQMIGSYESKFNRGDEVLTLNADGTFLQVFTSSDEQIKAQGKWRLSNQFLGPTEVTLAGNYASEDSARGSVPVYGERTLVVHKENGKIKLAINETADSYYVRVD